MASKDRPAEDRMIHAVGTKQERMLQARRSGTGFWSSLEVLGTVGWSVALPTLLGVAAGIFIDRRWPGRFSWTLMLLFAGLMFGCANAWMHLKGNHK
jgi:ATP synthase protein I